MTIFAPVRKAIVPLAVALVLGVLAYFGVVQTPELVTQVTLVVTAVLVYFIPNQPNN